jgi:hypothetical protein
LVIWVHDFGRFWRIRIWSNLAHFIESRSSVIQSKSIIHKLILLMDVLSYHNSHPVSFP